MFNGPKAVSPKAIAEDVFAKKETKDGVEYQLLFPAVEIGTVSIEVERNELSINGTDINGISKSKMLQLQGDLDGKLATAKLALGILTLNIPRASKAENRVSITVS